MLKVVSALSPNDHGVFLRFILAGILNAILYFTLANSLYERLKFHELLATTLAFLSVVIISFFISGRHVFKGETRLRDFAKYLLTLMLILCVTNLLIFLNMFLGVEYVFAQVISAIATVPISFLMLRNVVFKGCYAAR